MNKIEVTTIVNALMSISREIRDTDKEGVYTAYYNAKSEYEQLENQKKTMQAVYELAESVEGRTQSEIERRALACDEYKDFIKGLSEANTKMNKALAKVKAVEAQLEIYRSLNKHVDNTAE